ASAYSQNVKLELKLHEASVEDVFEEIKSKGGFTFLYRSKLVRDLPRVTISEKEASIEEVLDKILAPHDLAYEIYENTVVIRKDANKAHEENLLPKPVQHFEVRGIVSNENGGPLLGATIIETGTTNGTT